MPQDRTILQELMHFSARMHEVSQRGLDTALAGMPKCHYGMLERIHYAIERQGSGGRVYVSELVQRMRRLGPAVSRDLRTLEQEGLIERTADPADRRKIFVQITPEGERCRKMCEDTLLDYAQGVINRISPERLRQLTLFMQEYEQAVDAENAAWQTKQEGETHR